MGRSDEFGDYDDYGMPAMAQPQGSGRSGIMGRLKRSSGSKSSIPRGFGDDSDEEGADPGNALPTMNIRELSGLSDRHRYPTSRTMSIASTSTYDTTPIIPTLTNSTGAQKPGKTNSQYRQRMIDQRKQLLSSETGLPMPGAPGSGVGPGSPGGPSPGPGRSMSGITDPFSGFSNRAMSMSSQRASVQSRAMSMRGAANLSSPVLASAPPSASTAELSNLRNALDREKANSQQLRQAHQHLMAEHRHLLENQDTALEESYHALEAKFYALNEDYERLRESEQQSKRQAQAAQAAQQEAQRQAEQAQQQAQQGAQVPDDFLQMHEDLKRDLTIAQQRISAQTAELTSLRQLSRDAPQEHQRLRDINEGLEAELKEAREAAREAREAPTGAPSDTPRGPPSDAVQELQASHASLAAQVHSLSIELAESSRRELGLPTTQPASSAPSQLAALHAELAEERELRLAAQGHLDKPAQPNARAHAEATQLLDMRNQEYDLLLEKYVAQREQRHQEELPAREASSDTQLEEQLGELSQHTAFVESENARLQALLDEHSPKGPLGERLKAVEDQRNVLQDALRALRERKDYEIKLLGDRIKQLEARNAVRVASSSSANNRAPSSASASYDSEDERDELEMPRIRQQRPASPLHINFNMDVRGHRERSSPLPLALG